MTSSRPSLRLCQLTLQTRSKPSTSLASFAHSTRSYSSKYDNLTSELPARRLPILYDELVPTHSHFLSTSLASFVPSSFLPTAYSPNSTSVPPPSSAPLPPTHHLVYFNPALPANRLLADGTDPRQSPGAPFVRRMWAGGSLRFNTGNYNLRLDGGRYACLETIRDVSIKGTEPDERVFVGIERRVGKVSVDEPEDSVRDRLFRAKEEDFGDAALVERRNIVFMRERTPEDAKEQAAKQGQKILRPQNKPDIEATILPTPSLLFRYSALTFNAHAIHLDPLYCREVEGHRNLLVHGPLSFSLLLKNLNAHLAETSAKVQGRPERMVSVEYRNLAPLVVKEPITLCARKADEGKWEIWAQNPEGGIAVKGTVKTGGWKEQDVAA